MSGARRTHSARFAVESLEDRALLSTMVAPRLAMVHAEIVSHLHAQAIQTDPGAVAAIRNALKGGLGSEWAALIRREVRNPLSVVGGFVSGKIIRIPYQD